MTDFHFEQMTEQDVLDFINFYTTNNVIDEVRFILDTCNNCQGITKQTIFNLDDANCQSKLIRKLSSFKDRYIITEINVLRHHEQDITLNIFFTEKDETDNQNITDKVIHELIFGLFI